MLFQEPPPDTLGYMIAGYTVIFGTLILYLVSMIVRFRNLKSDMDVLKEIEHEE